MYIINKWENEKKKQNELWKMELKVRKNSYEIRRGKTSGQESAREMALAFEVVCNCRQIQKWQRNQHAAGAVSLGDFAVASRLIAGVWDEHV